jgi:hypothetical protein
MKRPGGGPEATAMHRTGVKSTPVEAAAMPAAVPATTPAGKGRAGAQQCQDRREG